MRLYVDKLKDPGMKFGDYLLENGWRQSGTTYTNHGASLWIYGTARQIKVNGSQKGIAEARRLAEQCFVSVTDRLDIE